MGGKSPEKAGLVRLVPRWHGHQGRCRALVSTVLYHFLILLQSPVSMKTWADAQYAKQFKAQQLELKPGSRRRAKGGSNLSLLLLPLRPLWRGGGGGGETGAQFKRKLAGQQKHRLWSQTWVCIPPLPLPGCVSFRASLYLSEPVFSSGNWTVIAPAACGHEDCRQL